jgi:hypothetical protein
MTRAGEHLREEDRQDDVARRLGVAPRRGAQREREQRVEPRGVGRRGPRAQRRPPRGRGAQGRV